MSGLPFFVCLQQCNPITLCEDRIVVFVYTATEKVLKFQLNLNRDTWLIATVLNRADPQKAKKRERLFFFLYKGIYFT